MIIKRVYNILIILIFLILYINKKIKCDYNSYEDFLNKIGDNGDEENNKKKKKNENNNDISLDALTSFLGGDIKNNKNIKKKNNNNNNNNDNVLSKFFGDFLNNSDILKKQKKIINEYIKNNTIALSKDTSVNVIIEGYTDNAISWLHKIEEYFPNKTIIITDEENINNNKLHYIKNLFIDSGAVLHYNNNDDNNNNNNDDNDIIILYLFNYNNKSSLINNDIRVNRIREIFIEYLKEEWNGVLPAVFTKGYYIHNVEDIMKKAYNKYKKYQGQKLNNIYISSKYDMYNVYCETYTMNKFIQRIIKNTTRYEDYLIILGSWSNNIMFSLYKTLHEIGAPKDKFEFIDIDREKLYNTLYNTDNISVIKKKKKLNEHLSKLSNTNLPTSSSLSSVYSNAPYIFINGKIASTTASLFKIILDSSKIEVYTATNEKLKKEKEIALKKLEKLREKIKDEQNIKIILAKKSIENIKNRTKILFDIKRKKKKKITPKGMSKININIGGKIYSIPSIQGDKSITQEQGKAIYNLTIEKLNEQLINTADLMNNLGFGLDDIFSSIDLQNNLF